MKSKIRMDKKNMRNDIEAFCNLRKPIADAVRKKFGADFNPKIVWGIATKNIIWSEPDLERARQEKLFLLRDEREINYFSQLADHLGFAAKYQMLAEVFSNQKIPELDGKKVPAIRGKLAGQTYYSFVTTPRQLLKVSFVNHRTLGDPEGMPTYQRLVQKSRLKKISDFINKGGFFPNNIILNLSDKPNFELVQKHDEAGVHYGNLFLPNRFKSAWVIDGQHRLYGFSHADEARQDDNIFVLAFEQLDRTKEADLFVKINHEQKSVPAGLLEELSGDLKWDSTKPKERISSVAAKLIANLNEKMGGALYGRLVKQGLTGTDQICLTTTGLATGLRQSGLIGTAVQKGTLLEPGPLSMNTNAQTLNRADIFLSIYFSKIQEAAPERWDKGKPGKLCTNTGIQGFSRLANALISHCEKMENFSAKNLEPDNLFFQIQDYLQPVLDYLSDTDPAILDQQLTVAFGSAGPTQYYFNLVKQVADKFPNFKPIGFDEWERESTKVQSETSDKKSKAVRQVLFGYIFGKLKSEFGEDYFDEKVPANLKKKSYERFIEEPKESRSAQENYLDILDFKQIVDQKECWPLWSDVFNIPLKGDTGKAKNTGWIAEYNDIRRIEAHSTNERGYKAADIEFLEWLSTELHSRLTNASKKGDEVAAIVLEKNDLMVGN